MADKKNDAFKLDDLAKKSSLLINGTDGTLEKENDELNNIVQNTIATTIKKFGARTGERVINYFNELNFSETFATLFNDSKNVVNSSNQLANVKTAEDFKRLMSDGNLGDINGMILSDATRLTLFDNYDSIYKHIPECAQALDTFKDNILSPDDYTKMSYSIVYDSDDLADDKKVIEKQLEQIREHYKLNEKSERIIEEALKYGESYIAVLSLDEDLSYMLNDPLFKMNKVLNEEELRTIDDKTLDITITKDDITLDEQTISAFKDVFSFDEEKAKMLSESTNFKKKGQLNEADLIKTDIANFINTNVVIGSKSEMLIERYLADNDKVFKDLQNKTDLPTAKKQHGKKSDNDKKPLGLNGTVQRHLEPRKTLELKIDDICYGYFYVEDGLNRVPTMAYLGQPSGREAHQNIAMAPNNTVASSTTVGYSPGDGSPAKQLNVSEEKLKLITSVFIDTISKKIDKDYIRNNKKFREFIYELVRQDYIIKKAVKITYFLPEEVIKFEVPAIYRKILFFAKLYLAVLTNDLLIKLGRSHDKRVFYINTGLDNDSSQAVARVIQDIKTKEYKIDSLNDINTILSLYPGRFDDYYMPSINGERPVEIDTLQGMDNQADQEFLEYLRNSMLSGIGVPKALIDAMGEMDFARTLSAQNANFLRSIIKYQQLLTEPFSRLIRRIYKYENTYAADVTDSKAAKEKDLMTAYEEELISVKFPAPASLNYSNLSDIIQSVDTNAEFIANQIVPQTMTENTEDMKNKLKAEIAKSLIIGVDWAKYEEMYKKLQQEATQGKYESDVRKAADPSTDPMMMGGMDNGF